MTDSELKSYYDINDPNFLEHYGILGMKWGVRRYQNKDGTRTPAGLRREQKKDLKWVEKTGKRITSKTEKAVKKDMTAYERQLQKTTRMRNSDGKLSKTYINQYNQQLAKLMNQRVGTIPAPSGKVLRYVAKRGEVGVHTALADLGYDMTQVRNGVNEAGRIAYRTTTLEKVRHSELIHHGVKGMKWGVRKTPEQLAKSRESGTMKLGDIFIGEKAKDYFVTDPATGERFKFIEGTKITKVEAFAGKGADNDLKDEVKTGLSEQFGGNSPDWQHCKGQAILDYYGEDRKSEVHWFQEETAGRHVFKNKKWKE